MSLLTLKFKVHGSSFIVIEWPNEEGIATASGAEGGVRSGEGL